MAPNGQLTEIDSGAEHGDAAEHLLKKYFKNWDWESNPKFQQRGVAYAGDALQARGWVRVVGTNIWSADTVSRVQAEALSDDLLAVGPGKTVCIDIGCKRYSRSEDAAQMLEIDFPSDDDGDDLYAPDFVMSPHMQKFMSKQGAAESVVTTLVKQLLESLSIREEYWITPDGLLYASDGGDTNHEGHVVEAIIREITGFLGLDWDMGPDATAFRCWLNDEIYVERYGEEEEDPRARLIQELVADRVFKTEQEADSAFMAIGGNESDARLHAIRYWGWIRVAGPNAEVRDMAPSVLKQAGEGLWDILSEESDADDDEIRSSVVRISTYGGRGRERREATIGELIDGEVGAGNTELEDIAKSGGAAVRAMDAAAQNPYYRGKLGDSLEEDGMITLGTYDDGQLSARRVKRHRYGKYTTHHSLGLHGHGRWRYPDGSDTVFWWVSEAPSPEARASVDAYLSKRGITGVGHVTMTDHSREDMISRGEISLPDNYRLAPKCYKGKLGDSLSESSVNLPVIRKSTMFHVGNLSEPRKTVGGTGNEGDGLPVSEHPEEWRGIAKLGDAPVWNLQKKGGVFVDVLRVLRNKSAKNAVLAWADAESLTEPSDLYRVTWEDEDGEERYFEYTDRSEAEAEMDEGRRLEVVEGGVKPSEKMQTWYRGFAGKNLDNALLLDMLVFRYAEQAGVYDGVWWNEGLDPAAHSAPRGSIYQGRLKEWKASKGNLGESLTPESIAQALNLIYNGEQEGFKHIPAKWVFTDKVHNSTFMVPVGSSVQDVADRVQVLRDSFEKGSVREGLEDAYAEVFSSSEQWPEIVNRENFVWTLTKQVPLSELPHVDENTWAEDPDLSEEEVEDNEARFAEVLAAIRDTGVVWPVLAAGKFVLDGYHRIAAVRRLGLGCIDVLRATPRKQRRSKGSVRESYGDEFTDDATDIETTTLPAGTELYHGTNQRFGSIQFPAWFSDSKHVAAYFSKWRKGGKPKVLKHVLNSDVDSIAVIRNAGDLGALGIDNPSDADESADRLRERGLHGWVIKGNYPEGDDIFLVRASVSQT